MTILRFIILFIIFCLSLMLFLPKQNLYYLAEKELKKYDIVICNEQFNSKPFGFKLNDALLYVKGVNIAKLDSVNISLTNIDISSKEIGYAKLLIDISNKSIIINFKPTKVFIKKYKIALKDFKKQKDGVYKYEYKLF